VSRAGKLRRWSVASIVAVWLMLPGRAFAQADEIQVYDAGLATTGTFNLTWHNNYTPAGGKNPAFPGGVVPDDSLNGVPEWALGVTKWFEAGLYLPLYSYDKNSGWGPDGFKLRTLFAVPDADRRRFVYGANFEFSYNAKRWDQKRFTSEIRPILGWHLRPIDVIVNPIFDTAYDGLSNFVFAPSARLAYNFSSGWALAAEEYADFGPVKDFHSAAEQAHQLYAIVDKSTRFMDIEAGIGFGLTSVSDKLTLKLILSRDLNR
jgi:hypothetical protein